MKVLSTKTLNDYRPVALTSVVMKSFGRMVKKSFSITQTVIDPLQIAYQPRKGVLNFAVRHLEHSQKSIGISLIDLDYLYQARATKRAKVILANPLHPLHAEFQPLLSKRRYTFPCRVKSNRYLKSFVPSAVRVLNNL